MTEEQILWRDLEWRRLSNAEDLALRDMDLMPRSRTARLIYERAVQARQAREEQLFAEQQVS